MNELKVTDVRVHQGDSAFLIDDGETSVLIDTGFGFTGPGLVRNVEHELGSRSLDYIFLTHSHYDHVLGAPYLARRYPGVKIVAGEYAASVFPRPGAKATMRRLDAEFAQTCGAGEYEDLVDELRVDIAVKDGDVVEAGSMSFTVIDLPGHTKCSVGFYLPDRKLLVATETFGAYYGNGVCMSSFLVGYQMTLDSFAKIKGLEVDTLLAPHYGLLDREEAALFLKNSEETTVKVASDIKEILLSGGTEEDAFAHFKSVFYRECMREGYPIEAFNLNTSIMIKLIRKELVDAE